MDSLLLARAWSGFVLVAGLLVAGCGGGSSSSSSSVGGGNGAFGVENIAVTEGAPWKINRPIDIRFNKDVDFDTVSLNTIQIVDLSGAAATGLFTQPVGTNGVVDRKTVRFQPTCPTREDNSDAGLQPGGVAYTLRIQSTGSGGVTVESTGGDPIELSRSVNFTTPVGDAQVLFLDTVPGPPRIRVRGNASVPLDAESATYLELGGDPDNRFYFVWSSTEQVGELAPGFEVPLNLYSEQETDVALVIHLDQPVQASAANISPERIGLQYLASDNPPMWEEVRTEPELIENCTETGAAVRLCAAGILPQGRRLRVNVRQGFADLTGDPTNADQTNFAQMVTTVPNNPNTADVTRAADELLAPFILSGDVPGSLEDTEAALATPRADWGGGRLQASFDFDGSGGPGGDFDWHLEAGSTVVLNTVNFTITGGPGGQPTGSQVVVNGVVDVRDLFVPQSTKLIIVGPNPCTILASGEVRIEGAITARGSNSPGVGTLNTTNIPEPGAAGNAGGGSGGTGSFLTTQSTPRGGNASGAFDLPGGGGRGGESGYAPQNRNWRRGAGGGGGRLGPDIKYPNPEDGQFLPCQVRIGMDAEAGFGGGAGLGKGAISQTERAQGGAIAPSPFVDGDDTNNFYGSLLVDPDSDNPTLIIGELDQAWAGSGGGGGGDAVQSDTFPLTPFNINGDEKGAGGGGGAGGIVILAVGPIVVGDTGSIVADGGFGGGGENTNFFDRVGGGSGGGAGGHIILSSADSITFEGQAPDAGAYYNESLAGHKSRPVQALGGEGGAGRDNKGGANEDGPRNWRCDAIPLAAFAGVEYPPMGFACFDNLADAEDPLGPVLGAGGDGGPGIIQLHVDDPAVNLRFPTVQVMGLPTYSEGLDVTPVLAPPPVGWNGPDAPADQMVPFFGKQSTGRSLWIPLGLARVNAEDAAQAENQVNLLFDGTDPGSGDVLNAGGEVSLLPPILGPDGLGDKSTQATPFITDGGLTMVFDASPLVGADEVYKRNPQLVTRFTLRLSEAGSPANKRDYVVVDASYDGANDFLSTVVTGSPMTTFQPAGGVEVSLIPQFFRVITNGQVDSFPDNKRVTVLFSATRADSSGMPNAAIATDFTPDISTLNMVEWDFFRFQVEFDLNTDPGSGVDLDTPRPALEFLRVPIDF